ncbi:MAG: Ig domain-containing protein [Paludibacteraceae bacterium]|nr:Ig domain-containing protein [Paludibacteraceae bacterium]
MGMGMGNTQFVFTIEEPATVAVTGVTLNQNEAQMTVGGETLTLTATVNPNNATDQSVSWSTSDANVATVENGVVTAVAAGNATITVTTTDGSFTATCAVTVTAPEPEPQPTTVTWGATEFSSFGVDYLHAASRTVKGITVTVNAANQNFINVTEYGTTFNATIDNAFTFSTELGNITKIECTTLYTKGTLGDGWTIGANSATWEGNTNTLNFGNAGSMLVVSNIIFTIGGGSTPAPAEDVNITPNEDPDHAGVYYSTFYDSANKYALPAGVEAYVATLDGAKLLLSKIADAGQTIPANNAVILKSTVTPFTLNLSDEEPVSVGDNDLEGTDVQINTPANCYVLAGNDGVGFYHYTASMLNPHKAYVIYSGSNQAPHRMPFIFDAATGIENGELLNDENGVQKVIRDGRLIIIKDGVEYNAQGQVVK